MRRLSPGDLGRPCGPAEGPWAEHAMAELVLHINREVLHHGAEVALLRDLHLWHHDGTAHGGASGDGASGDGTSGDEASGDGANGDGQGG